MYFYGLQAVEQHQCHVCMGIYAVCGQNAGQRVRATLAFT